MGYSSSVFDRAGVGYFSESGDMKITVGKVNYMDKEILQVIYWLAKVYQENYEEFMKKDPKSEEWRREAYMHFSTVQGFRMRMFVKKLAEQEVDGDMWQRGINKLKKHIEH